MGAPSTKRLQPQPLAAFPAPRLEPPPRTHGLPAVSGKEPPDPASRPPDPAPSRRIERGSMLPTPPCRTAAGPKDTGSGPRDTGSVLQHPESTDLSHRSKRLSWPASKGIWPPSPQHAGARAKHRPDLVAAHAGEASSHSPCGIQPRPASSLAKAAMPDRSQSKGGRRQLERARAPRGHARPSSTPATRADPATGPWSKPGHAA